VTLPDISPVTDWSQTGQWW